MSKFVLHVIPSYIMNIYLSPNSIVCDIEKMINYFGGKEVPIVKFIGCPMTMGLEASRL
jgi:Ca2+-dependent lipid-binding protein